MAMGKVGKVTILFVSFLAALFFARAIGMGAVDPPSQAASSQFALEINPNLIAPDDNFKYNHQPLEDWQRQGHREYVLEHTEAECLACHSPAQHCNQCHTYVGGVPLIPTLTPMPTPEETHSEEPASHDEAADSTEATTEEHSEGQESASEEAGFDEAEAQALFTQYACIGCHSLEGAQLVGPALNDRMGTEVELESGETVVYDEEYIRESITDSMTKVTAGFAPAMPPFTGTDAELDILVEFLSSK